MTFLANKNKDLTCPGFNNLISDSPLSSPSRRPSTNQNTEPMSRTLSLTERGRPTEKRSATLGTKRLGKVTKKRNLPTQKVDLDVASVDIDRKNE